LVRWLRPGGDAMTLTGPERMELERRVASRRGRADEARRARCILLTAAKIPWADVRERPQCNDSYIARWAKRSAAERLAGLYSGHCRQAATRQTARLEERILDATRRPLFTLSAINRFELSRNRRLICVDTNPARRRLPRRRIPGDTKCRAGPPATAAGFHSMPGRLGDRGDSLV
jgi:hypothetical protein